MVHILEKEVIAIADVLLKSSDTLNGDGRSGLALANGAKSGHSCSVEIIEGVRQHAAEQGLPEDEALKKSMQAKAKA